MQKNVALVVDGGDGKLLILEGALVDLETFKKWKEEHKDVLTVGLTGHYKVIKEDGSNE